MSNKKLFLVISLIVIGSWVICAIFTINAINSTHFFEGKYSASITITENDYYDYSNLKKAPGFYQGVFTTDKNGNNVETYESIIDENELNKFIEYMKKNNLALAPGDYEISRAMDSDDLINTFKFKKAK